MFLVPSFCMVGSGSFVPGPFLVGFGSMIVGVSMVHLTIFSTFPCPPYIHAPNLIAGFHVKLAPRNLSLNSIAICAIMVQTLYQDDVALYVSWCCTDIERSRPKKGGFFLQETMPCIHGPSLYVWMPAGAFSLLSESEKWLWNWGYRLKRDMPVPAT